MKLNKSFIIASGLILVFGFLAFSSSLYHSPTFDEVHYLGTGKYILTHHDFDLQGARLHPPLFYYLSSLPFLFIEIPEKFFRIADPILRGQNIVFLRASDGITILTRLPFILAGMILALGLYLWSSAVFSRKSGLFCLFLFCFCPNILAHTQLATPDILLAASFFLSFYFLWKICTSGLSFFSFCGLTLAGSAALLSKYTGLILLPAALLIIIFHFRLWERGRMRFFFRKRYFHFFLLSSLSVFIIIWACYFFHFGKPAYSEDIYPVRLSAKMTDVNLAFGFPVPFPEYFEGLFIQMKNLNLVNYYLNGEISPKGWFSYFLYAFIIKTPVVSILLIILSFALLAADKKWRPVLSFILLPSFLFFAVMSYLRADLGIRYVLPCYPFFFLACGAAAEWAFQKSKMVSLAVVTAAATALCYENLSIYPDYLAYFNQFIGGPDNGQYHLLDSNLDWGQDLKGLSVYMKKNNIELVNLCYFGTAPPEYYGIRYVPLDPLNRTKGFCAVSATHLHGVFFNNKEYLRWLSEYRPFGNIGHSIFLYNIP